jgi:hypothetical protein
MAVLDCVVLFIDVLRNTAGCHMWSYVCNTFALIVVQDASKTNTNTSSGCLAG